MVVIWLLIVGVEPFPMMTFLRKFHFLLNPRGPPHAVDFWYMHGMGLASGFFDILRWLVVEPTPLKNITNRWFSFSPGGFTNRWFSLVVSFTNRWFQPHFEKFGCSQSGNLPQIRGEHKKYLSCHHPVLFSSHVVTWAIKQDSGCLGYIGDSTPQLNRDYIGNITNHDNDPY